jgi:DNA polymerase III epsilon subunit-like protein
VLSDEPELLRDPEPRKERTMTRLCFIDTETTSLRPDRRAWEVGLIVRDPGKPDAEHHWFVDVRDLDLGNADVMSLKIGRFYERHPQVASEHLSSPAVRREDDALRTIERLTRGAHLVGAVPNFDADVLGTRMRANGICPSWHYHLIDVEALAVGCLTTELRLGNTEIKPGVLELPWKSDDLSAMLGIRVSGEDRHTALGDAKWAMRIYDTVMGNA